MLTVAAIELYVVAVDWPGHGLSSHIPPGTRHAPELYLRTIKYVVEGGYDACLEKWTSGDVLTNSCMTRIVHVVTMLMLSCYTALKWNRFSLLGHSMGESFPLPLDVVVSVCLCQVVKQPAG